MSEIEKKALGEKEEALVDEALDDAAGGALSKERLLKPNPYFKPDDSNPYYKPDPYFTPDNPFHKDWKEELKKQDPYSKEKEWSEK